jgi:hypothetical protein
LVTENERKLWIGQFAIDNVKIGPANGASAHTNEQLSTSRFWLGPVAKRESLSDFLEHHRTHADLSTGRRLMATVRLATPEN